MRSHAERIAGGVLAYIAAHSLGEWDDFGAGTAYTLASVWPGFIGPGMPASPHRILVATPTVRSYVRADVTQGIQLRFRGTPDEVASEVRDHAEAVHDLFYPNGFPLSNTLLGDVRVGAVLPGADELPLDQDGNRRHGYIMNLRIRARRT